VIEKSQEMIIGVGQTCLCCWTAEKGEDVIHPTSERQTT